jgi:type VI secretion system protein VasD
MRRRTILGVLASALLSGCGSKQPALAPQQAPAPCPASDPVVSISASDRVNSSAGEGRPVQVRLYQLKSDARLATAKFEDIWQDSAATLKEDLLKMEEHTVYPGETKLVKVARNPEAQNLAAVALFREPQGKSWFVTYELQAPRKEPPCSAKEVRVSVWLDRMQVEDGQGRSAEAPASSPEPSTSKPGEGASGAQGR